MTNCNREPICFPRCKGRLVEAAFADGDITSNGGAVLLHEVLVERFIASFKTPRRRLVLDFDATDDPAHGMREGCFFHGYYDHHCFLPFYVFCSH